MPNKTINQIIIADAMDALKGLPDNSVNTCVTSPPYYGLRDYGTARWEGGRPDCDHVVGEIRTGMNLAESAYCTRGGALKVKDATVAPRRMNTYFY